MTLQNFWSYKYESGEGGIQCHADDAQVNLNFWVTPDESNTDLSRGGLVVWHTEPERRFEEDGGEYKHAPTKSVFFLAILEEEVRYRREEVEVRGV